MRVDTFKCDVCGEIKRENNHWFRIDQGKIGLELHAWGGVAASSSTIDLCSDQCVITVVQKWLTAQALAVAPLQDRFRAQGSLAAQRLV